MKDELYILYDIARAVNSSLNIEEVLKFIMKVTTEIFKAEAGSIMLINKDNILTIEAAQGLSEEIVKNTRIKLGEGIAGWVAQTGENLLLDGKVRDARFKLLVDRKDEIKSSLCVPLKTKEKIIGVLMIRNPTSCPTFTEEHLRFLSVIADQVSIAIENARLYNEEKERVEELSRLYKEITYEKLKIEAMMINMADGVVVTEPSGIIVLINPFVEKAFGVDRKLIVGKHYSVLFASKQYDQLHQKVLKEGNQLSMELVLNKQEFFCYRLCATPMKDEDGSIQGVVSILQDISELKRIDQMKSDFVSLVTHELKAPLTSIQGFVEVLMSREFPREKVLQYLSIVKEETVRLVRLINNILDISRLESGTFKLNKFHFDLGDLIRSAIEAVKPQVKTHKIEFKSYSDSLNIYADYDMIMQAINNLLSNAIKYSPNGGRILVEVKSISEYIEIAVIDEGIGIAQGKLPYLFEKFYRVDDPITKEIGGTGLGLATVKYIVEAHGGRLSVKSKEGKGSTFIIFLPHESLA